MGRPADALERIISQDRLDAIIMVDASLKLEGEESATVAHGFGAAIGGIGTDRFRIEAVATTHKIPVFSVIVRQSVKEAITLMTRAISEQAGAVRLQIYDMIRDNTKKGQSVLVIGVGNTAGITQ